MTKRNCWTAALCLGLMLTGGHRLRAEDPEVKKPLTEIQKKMTAEGWTRISDSVFERQTGTKVEHLGYGRQGLGWTIGKLTRQLEGLMREYESYPSEDLAKIIDDLSLKIANAKLELRNMPVEMSSITGGVAGGSCSNICYSATADAYYPTGSQGVAAVAEAKFNSTCGYSGDTYAYAYARATQGTTTNTVTQSDPRSGTNVTSYASASANGGSVSGIPCYSEASSFAQSSALGISYSTSDTNSSCPLPSCTVTISGTGYEYFNNYGCRSRTWTATVNPGCTPSTYEWKLNGTVVGYGSTYTRSVCAYDSYLSLEVTVNGSAYDSHEVYIDYTQMCGDYVC